MEGDLVKAIVEKPSRESAPSNLVLCGRYVFSEDTAELLNEYSYEKFGELQSIEVQKHWMENSGLVGVHLRGIPVVRFRDAIILAKGSNRLCSEKTRPFAGR